ncbi:MAG: XrtV sorting system accessory protein [Pseudomonadota bacterium]
METIFDFLSVTLFIATASLFFLRFRHENPPLAPYLLVSLVAAVGNWLGNHGGGLAAVALLIAGAFLTLHLASEPYREDPKEPH